MDRFSIQKQTEDHKEPQRNATGSAAELLRQQSRGLRRMKALRAKRRVFCPCGPLCSSVCLRVEFFWLTGVRMPGSNPSGHGRLTMMESGRVITRSSRDDVESESPQNENCRRSARELDRGVPDGPLGHQTFAARQQIAL